MTGLLWFDNDKKRPVAQKIADAIDRYRQKLGRAPTVCYINEAEAGASDVGNVKVVAARNVLKWHYFVGVE